MLRNSIVLGALLAVGGLPASAAVTYFGPTPYAQRSDSPFAQAIANGIVRVEDFEDGLLNTGFATATCGAVSGMFRASVDEDDGVVDGLGTGRTWTSLLGPNCDFGLLEFRFEPDGLGRLPNFVGFVVVGSGAGEFIDGKFVYRAYPSIFDANGIELSDDRFFELPEFGNFDAGSTYYSRFIGFTSDIGIARLTVNGFSRLDHLQYGYLVPEPSVALLAAAVLGLAAFWRRRPA
jgi:MYXO-CTERM domain-containing protein